MGIAGENFQRHSCNEADRTALGLYTSHSVVKSSKSSSSTGGFQEHHQLGVSLKNELGSSLNYTLLKASCPYDQAEESKTAHMYN
jgi:hypothetical protein